MSAPSPGELEARLLRRNLRWAITLTNIIGMPILLVFIAVIMGITASNLASDFQRDPLYLPFNFLILGAISLSFVLIHYFHVIKVIVPAEEYLRRRDKKEGNHRAQAKAALTASELLPYRTLTWSVIFYLFGTVIAALSILIAYTFSFRQISSLYLGATATGMIISVFQFYTTRRVLLKFQSSILSDHPDLLLDEGDDRGLWFKISIKRKFMLVVFSLTAVSVILTAIFALSAAHHSLQRQIGLSYVERLKGEGAEELDHWLEQGPHELKRLVDRFYKEHLPADQRSTIVLVDREGQNLLPAPPAPELLRLVQIIQQGVGWSLERSRPSAHVIEGEIYSAAVKGRGLFGREKAIVRLKTEKTDLFVFIPASQWRDTIVWMYSMVYGLMFLALLPLCLLFGKLAAEEIRDPLVSLMESLVAMASGDLSRNVTVTGKDEIGVVARAMARAVFGLRRLIGGVDQAAGDIEQAAGQIQLKSNEVAFGSGSQVKAVDESSASMEQMRGGVRSIADSIQTLATSAEESSSSILEVQATIEEVAKNVDTLSKSVMETTTAIQSMNASIKEVADDVQDLTRQAGESMSALQEMERMIHRVSDGSQETAAISEQVSRDAELGDRSVSMTIAGIDQIQESSRGVAEVITRLGKKAREIGNVLTVIEEVTEQTNLLALNAAIIAAQAGEHGRGFAVVADEIKDLAERTAASTQEIADMIRSVQDDAVQAVDRVSGGAESINEGVRLSQEAGNALKQIQDSARRALEQTMTIAESAQVQAEKSKKVMEFMNGVNSLIVRVAQATQEQTKSGDQISEASDRMGQIAQQVKRATQEQLQGSRQITQAIEHIAEITRYINNSQAEQLKSTDLMGKAVLRIKEAADNNQLMVEDMTQTVKQLKLLSDSLREMLAEFRL